MKNSSSAENQSINHFLQHRSSQFLDTGITADQSAIKKRDPKLTKKRRAKDNLPRFLSIIITPSISEALLQNVQKQYAFSRRKTSSDSSISSDMHIERAKAKRIITKEAEDILNEINQLLKEESMNRPIDVFTQFHSDVLNHPASVREPHEKSAENPFSSSNHSFSIIEESALPHNHHGVFMNAPSFAIKIHLKDLANKDRTTLKLKTEIKAEEKLKMISSVDEHFILISFGDDILEIEQIIKLLHPFVRFIVIRDVEIIVLEIFSISSSRLQTNKNIIKVFVELAKNFKKNRIYKNSKNHKIVTKKSVYLRINDKKNKKIAKKSLSYDFIDSYGVNFKKENVWFIQKYTEKEKKNKTTLRTVNEHREKKDRAWKKYLKNAKSFWIERIIWKWKLIQTIWGFPGIIFPTDHSKEEMFDAANSKVMSYSQKFHEVMYQI